MSCIYLYIHSIYWLLVKFLKNCILYCLMFNICPRILSRLEEEIYTYGVSSATIRTWAKWIRRRPTRRSHWAKERRRIYPGQQLWCVQQKRTLCRYVHVQWQDETHKKVEWKYMLTNYIHCPMMAIYKFSQGAVHIQCNQILIILPLPPVVINRYQALNPPPSP